MAANYFEPFTFEGQQKSRNTGFPFPLALKTKDNWTPTFRQAVTAIQELRSKNEIFDLVQQHGGAILFRGLPIKTPDDYSQIAHAFGFKAHEEVGRPPLRTILAPNIKTANEGPPELPIWPHNEYGWSTINPAWIMFLALKTPNSGGQTPINSSIDLAAAIQTQAPEFYQKLLEKGVKYVYRYGVKEVKSNTGTSLFDAYGRHVLPTDDPETVRQKIEAEVRRHSNRFEWHDDGSISVTHIVPVIRKHKSTGLTTFFGNVTSAYGRSKYHGATEPPYLGDDGSYHPLPTYGDGTPIENKYLDLALSLAESTQVLVNWQEGDIVLLDNYAVMHSRSPWTGQRTVLAALWDEDGRIDDFEEGKEILKSSPSVPPISLNICRLKNVFKCIKHPP